MVTLKTENQPTQEQIVVVNQIDFIGDRQQHALILHYLEIGPEMGLWLWLTLLGNWSWNGILIVINTTWKSVLKRDFDCD